MLTRIPRPQTGEYLAYYDRYIELVTHEADAVTALMRQVPSINHLARLDAGAGRVPLRRRQMERAVR